MPVVVAVLVLLAALCLLNLVLVLAIMRRLREHTGHLDRLLTGRPGGGLGPGEPVPPVEVDGVPLELTGATLVGFFSPGCAPCAEQIPHFLDRAATGAERVLAVVVGEDGAPSEERDRLAAAVPVTDERPGGPLAQAFGEVLSYPTLFLVRDGVVEATDGTLAALPAPAPAR